MRNTEQWKTRNESAFPRNVGGRDAGNRDELGEHRYSSGRFDDAARLMEQITTSDDLIDFLTLPGYRLLA